VKKIFYHSGANGEVNNGDWTLESPFFSGLNNLGQPRKLYAAQAELSFFLGAHPVYAADLGKPSSVDGHSTAGIYGFSFQCGSTAVMVVWADETATSPWVLTMPSGVQVYDVMGNNQGMSAGALGPSPLYFVSTFLNAATLAAGSAAILTVNAASSIPVFTTQAASQSVTAGGTATFSVAATGAPPPTYQWQRQAAGTTTWTNLTDSTLYSGTGTGMLTVTSVTTAMSGDLFQCVISNAGGTVTSSPAALVVPVPLTVSTFAGRALTRGSTDGPGSTAQFNGPADVAVDSSGNVYVADAYNDTIRKVTPAGTVSTVAGSAGTSGSADGTGTAARFNHPAGVVVDTAGNIFVADTDNNTIRKISSAGTVMTFAGRAGESGHADGIGTAAQFHGPSGLAVDAAGNLWVADTLNHTLRKITAAGVVSTFAGIAGAAGSIDGAGTAARFYGAQGLALDGGDNLFVADTNNQTIRKTVLSTGVVTTVAGVSGAAGSVDAPGTMARFDFPSALTIDGAGNLYVADTNNSTVRKITPSGVVSTIAGKAGVSGTVDGVGDDVRFNHPTGIAVDGFGSIYVADTDSHTVRLGMYPALPVITTQPQSQTVSVGSNVQFSVTASGQPAPRYQWYFNGTAISGATGSSLSLADVQSSAAGDYTVKVSNNSGSVVSTKATLTVNSAPPAVSSSGGGGGGGAIEPLFAGLLVLLRALQQAFTFWKASRRHPS
jgi:sugar lactone lactonase YvrE